MDVKDKRKEIIDWVSSAGEETLELLDQIRSAEDSDWWDELTTNQKTMISEGQKDLDEGRVANHAEVKIKYGL